MAARPELAAAKALAFLCLGSLWVACASAAAAAVMFAARDYTEGSPVVDVLGAVSIRGLLFGLLLGLVAPLLVLRAALCGACSGEEPIRMVSGASADSIQHDTSLTDLPFPLGFLMALPFFLLVAIGCVVLVWLSPTKDSLTCRIWALVTLVRIVGSAIICCCVILPSMALKLWRMKLRSASSIV